MSEACVDTSGCGVSTQNLGGALKYKRGVEKGKVAVPLIFKMEANIDPGDHRLGCWTESLTEF